MASCYRMSVPEFDRQMGLGLGGLTGAAGWLLLPAQSVETIENLADLARLEPAALRVIEIRRHGLIEGSTIPVCLPESRRCRCPVLEALLARPALGQCEVHATPLRAIPRARVRKCLNLAQLLFQVGRYERESQQESYDSILR
jgi:hypothetical protein